MIGPPAPQPHCLRQSVGGNWMVVVVPVAASKVVSLVNGFLAPQSLSRS